MLGTATYQLRASTDASDFCPLVYAEAFPFEGRRTFLNRGYVGMWTASRGVTWQKKPRATSHNPKFGPNARSTSASGAPLRSAMSRAWAASILPTLK